MGAAWGWGGLPGEDVSYSGGPIEKNDGETVHTLTVKDVPVDGFWSVSVYNKDGFFDINERGVYSYNSKTSKQNTDGSVTVQFGQCDGVDNCLEIMAGWYYAIRLYQPQEAIINGSWLFPAPVVK